MPVFAYEGRTPTGAAKGELEAASRTAALAELRRRSVFVTRMAEKAVPRAPAETARRIKDRDMAIFTRQFSTMIDAGLPLVQCLNILSEQSEAKALRGVTASVARTVEQGATLADALRRHPKSFGDLFTNMVEVGEAGGILDVILQRLATYIEKAAALKRKVKSALAYPASITGIALLVIAFMLTFVIPTFAAMFKEMGAELPVPTRVVIGLSDALRGYLWLLILVAAAGGYAFRKYYRTRAGTLRIDGLLLKVPVFGPILHRVAVARFTRTLGTLVQSGIPLLEALRITATTTGNAVVEHAVLQCRAFVTEGKALAEPLRASGVFPPMVTQMVSVGEQTGALDIMLTKVADFYDDEVDTAVATLTSLLEPIMIVLLGVVVGGLVVAMYLPIFKLVTLIK